ncbi:hypothetical protein I2F27_11210 [Acinetobacter sp. B5B]|uniref:hypothetical protein n=1 Tax=Acinetobacter baretiae TaxID=2605383 RepID=UPI0018C1E74D|nr:hypothetical protein [Acinetobacter baretiae]MBF7683887.1 hypothetical protein [Acinetobacter baretiae]
MKHTLQATRFSEILLAQAGSRPSNSDLDCIAEQSVYLCEALDKHLQQNSGDFDRDVLFGVSRKHNSELLKRKTLFSDNNEGN